MSNVYEFVKETSHYGESKWYTMKNGRYVSNSLSFKEDEARKLFETIKIKGDLEPSTQIVEVYEKEN